MSTKRKVSPCSSPRSEKCNSPVTTEHEATLPKATLPKATLPEAAKVQLAQTKWGDPIYLAERKKIEDKLDLLDIKGKTGTKEYKKLIDDLDDLDMDSMDDFINNGMDIKTKNKVIKLTLELKKIIYELKKAHDIKNELEGNLQGKKKKTKTDNPMSPSLTDINTLIESLEKEKEESEYKYTQTMNTYDIENGRTLLHAYGGTKKRKYRRKRQTKKRKYKNTIK